jgi:hypothetical protein
VYGVILNTRKYNQQKTCWSVSSLFKRERRGNSRTSQPHIANRLTSQQALWNRRKRKGAIQRVQSRALFTSHVWHNGANSCSMQYSMQWERTLLDLTRINLYQSFIKTAINTAITVKLLRSKVTLLNTCEKLKMPHEKQLDLGNIKSKVNETCYCETCLSQLG